jgi:hypothetical protein
MKVEQGTFGFLCSTKTRDHNLRDGSDSCSEPTLVQQRRGYAMELERWTQTISSQSASSPGVSNWLENQRLFSRQNQAEPDTADRHDESNKLQLGFTSALYQACLSLYGEIYKQCRLTSRCPQESQARISQHLGPFISFSEVLEHRKIDLCLGKAPEVNDLTVKLLYHVGRTLEKSMGQPTG